MNNRLREIIQYKTNGRHKQFAELIGMSPQYLAKLLHGANFGLQPVLTILKALPEVNARWFLLGEGEMLADGGHRKGVVRSMMIDHLREVLDLERFVPVMSNEELQEYERLVTGKGKPDFGQEARSRWIAMSAEKYQAIEARVKSAMEKSEELCRQQTAKK